MKLKCIKKHEKDLPKDALEPRTGFNAESSFPLTIDKEYVVYGLTVRNNYIWYYICDDDYDFLEYPVWKPSPLFKVISTKISRTWVFNVYIGENKLSTYPILGFPEWVNDPNYYNLLTDGNSKAVEIFNKYKQILDEEENMLFSGG